jgi:hypothetical protein
MRSNYDYDCRRNYDYDCHRDKHHKLDILSDPAKANCFITSRRRLSLVRGRSHIDLLTLFSRD